MGDADWHQSLYDQLYDLASRALHNESPGHSLQPTLLVNEAYLKLVGQDMLRTEDRSRVLAAGATIIRRLLVDYARKRKAEKRGGVRGRGTQLHFSLPDYANANGVDLIELNDALESLAAQHSRAAKVVELRFFGGFTGEETAHELAVSLRTVRNDWRFAKAWLYDVMEPASNKPIEHES